jgi:hypothetical protein
MALTNASLQLNGHDRFSTMDGIYFNSIQPYQHFNNTPDPASTGITDLVNVYSFALKPNEHQPSGTCNFSRIDTAQLKFTGTAFTGKIYAVNYNVLRIMSGMGGLAYSN